MTYTEELLSKADAVIPRVTLEDFNKDSNSKVMIDVRQHEELQASGTVGGAIHIPKGVIEFRLNNNDEISFDTRAYWSNRGYDQIMEQIVLRFKIPNPESSYHMPIIINPNSYSTWWSG